MKKAIILPRKYIQGRGVISEIADYCAIFGSKPLVVWGKRTRAAVADLVLPSIAGKELSVVETMFGGECTKEESTRVSKFASENNCDCIVAIGGGKVIDMCKASANWARLPNIVVPTIASNDAPASACTVWYNDAGECTGFDFWPFNPDIIIVDTQVVVDAPLNTFIAGIGDALATWVEVAANIPTHARTCAGGLQTMTAIMMAKTCFEILMEFGPMAVKAAARKAVTPAVEKVVEANSFLSSVGWESGGLACAHAIGNNLPLLKECHEFMHGDKVSFGIVTQLCLEDNLDADYISKILDFMVEIGLPVCLADLNLQDVSEERLMEFAKVVAGEGSLVHNHAFVVTPKDVYDAMMLADAMGKAKKAKINI